MRSMLDDAWDAAIAASAESPDLRAQLRANETTARKNVASGALASVSANGRTTQFSTSGASGEEICEAWRDLVDLYDKTEPSFETEAEVKAEMMALLVPVTEWENDYSEACR